MRSQSLDCRNRLAALRLARTPRLGPVTYLKLINRFGSPVEALEALPDFASSRRTQLFAIPREDAALAEMEAIDQAGDHLFLLGDDAYPTALACIPDPPIALTARGRCELLDRPALGIVGSRNASAAGRRLASDLARELATSGMSIVSGLARGIDGAAHRGAGADSTIAAVAGGVDVIYPPEHSDLHLEIARDGLIVSECSLGTRPVARDFPRRNRVISGLSLGTLVVEAALQSGSLITARLANEQGREVMALPGSPLDPRARGTNRLLREGAQLVETADDIMEILSTCSRPQPARLEENEESWIETDLQVEMPLTGAGGSISVEGEPSASEGSHQEPTAIFGLLSMAPVSIDELVRQSGRPLGDVQAELIELELAGAVQFSASGLVQRTENA